MLQMMNAKVDVSGVISITWREAERQSHLGKIEFCHMLAFPM